VCGCSLAGGYKRCYGAEKIVKGLKVPCPNNAYGCYAVLFRHEESAHLQDCKYQPFHCPAEDCTFTDRGLFTLWYHFTTVHRWPSNSVDEGTANLALVDGFNIIVVNFPADHLILLKVTPESYGRVVTPIHIRRRGVSEKFRLKLAYETPCGTHRLDYAFNVASTDLSASGGLPSHDDRFDFVVPKSVQPLDLDTIKVAVTCWHLD
jgi:E3 ubiquitin-protein ligase SIAH1